MTSLELLEVAGLTSSPLFSQCATAGPMVFTAGQVGIDEHGKAASTYEGQIVLALSNLDKCLRAARVTSQNIIKITTYIVGYNPDLSPQPHTRHLLKFLDGHRPTMTLAPVPYLARSDLKFEIEATAIRSPTAAALIPQPRKATEVYREVDVVVVGAGLS